MKEDRRTESEEDVTVLEGQSDAMGGLVWPSLALKAEEEGHEPRNAGDL